MHYSTNLALASLLLSIPTVRSLISLDRRAPCTILSRGYEALDDAPTINSAIRTCGSIILPSTESYSIRSPLDLSPCQKQECDIQLEGTLLLSTDWAYWLDRPAFISMKNVHGAKIRSLNGTGLIDGQGKGFYQRSRTMIIDQWVDQPIVLPILSSTNITISGLTVKNAPKEFFRVDAQSQNIHFSNINILVEDQWYQTVYTRDDSVAFQFRNSSNISLSSVSVNMRSTDPTAPTGSCVAIDVSTSDVRIDNITCNGTWFGALVQMGSVDSRKTCSTYPPFEDQWVRNVAITNYTTNSLYNSGFMNIWLGREVTNITYDGVDIIGGQFVGNEWFVDQLCYWKSGYSQPSNFAGYTNIWFKNYRGNLAQPQGDCGDYTCLSSNIWCVLFSSPRIPSQPSSLALILVLRSSAMLCFSYYALLCSQHLPLIQCSTVRQKPVDFHFENMPVSTWCDTHPEWHFCHNKTATVTS